MNDLDQALRNLLDGLQTIREIAEGLETDARDLVDQIGLSEDEDV